MAKKRPGKSGKTPLTPEQAAAEANRRALEGVYSKEGVNAGNAINNIYLKPGALGRVDTALPGGDQSLKRYSGLHDQYAMRDPMQSDVVDRLKGGLEGYTSEQNQAQREQMMRGLQSNYATSSSNLARAQARGKVYGAAGAAQAANLETSTQNSKNQLDQDLMVKNIDEKQRRLTEYGQYGRQLNEEEYGRRADINKNYADEESRLRQEELDRQKINLGQANAETAAQIGAITGAGGTALAQKNAKEAQRIQREGIRAINGGDSASRGRARAARRA